MLKKVLALAVVAACAAKPLHAVENHALLIGVSDYSDERIIDLEGPLNDVAALKLVLVEQWQYPSENITTLTNDEATEAGILMAIEQLKTRSKPEDSLFIYFSGHGTSARDNTLGARLHLPNGSGAIVAYDFDPEKFVGQNAINPRDRNDGLIVGRSDLRPLFNELDKDRTVWVAFDACFAGNSARGVNSRYTPHKKRFLSIASSRITRGSGRANSEFENCSDCGNALETDYPYSNVVYFGASAEHELAVDISQAEIDAGFASTVDGKAHGAFTDALLRSLIANDGANTDLSYRELFQRIRRQFQQHCESCGHTPVMLPSSVLTDLAVVDKPVFPRLKQSPLIVYKTKNDKESESATSVLIDDETLAKSPWLASVVTRNISGLYEGNGALVLSNAGNYLEARSIDGKLITLLDNDSDAALHWVSVRQALQQRISDDAVVADELAVEVAHPLHGAEFYFGETVTFSTRVNKPSRLLVLALDTAGDLHRLYPASEREWDSIIYQGDVVTLPAAGSADLRVTAPAGTDEILFYALPHNHQAWEQSSWETFDNNAVDFKWLDTVLHQSPSPYSAAHRRLIAVAPE